MSKRSPEDIGNSQVESVITKSPFNKLGQKYGSSKNEEDIGEFEDPWEDEFETESEEEIIENSELDSDEDVEEEDKEQVEQVEQVYLPGQELGKDEILEADQSTYVMLHSLNVKWPCLSFDILWDNLGDERKMFPVTAYIVAGTQADKPKNNELMVMKMSQLYKTQNDDNESKSFKHYGGVNRVRVTASWADTGKVHIWDLDPLIKALDTSGFQISQKALKPLYTIESHSIEGFAMDWSGTVPGRLLTGDLRTNIYLTTKSQSTFKADRNPFVGHTSSVEDLQWSPVEMNVFASASADQTIRIWDIRGKKKHALCIKAHETDVNVITWNSNQETPSPVANFKWHSAPITSIEWHPTEESVLGVSGSDDQISIWDLSVEHDTEESSHKIFGKDGTEVPSQLMFVHQGQNDIKEIHWHPQIPGCMISTSETGFNIFKTVSI
ncbi:9358_t:CDS:2 [Diversispora eburnea]|uniref:9358_t:CDS:1 n=1 Tax=Diversispora eburnea TaxID=1213867 RepID=A0A9N8YNJ1_9GLOM|nr:9358_t:CDS:2 [Diversispora eburnea]